MPFSGVLHMPVKPFGNVAVAVKVVIAFSGIAAEQIGVLFRIQHGNRIRYSSFPETHCLDTFGHTLIAERLCKSPYSSERRALITSSNSALKSSVFHCIRWIKPSGVKAISRAIKITTQIADTCPSALKLRTSGHRNI